MRRRINTTWALLLAGAWTTSASTAMEAPPPVPAKARLVMDESWATGTVDGRHWYLPRRKWGDGNHGVSPENVRVVRDRVGLQEQNVLECEAHGDHYDGPVRGHGGRSDRVGAMIVSRDFFASGRFEVVMKIGSTAAHPGGPTDPRKPAGTVPAIWTYAYRYVEVPREQMYRFSATMPLYNPLMRCYGGPINEYWSEIDFPEFSKAGRFDRPMYNTFCQNRHESREFDLATADGQYHTYVTEWRTRLMPIADVTDEQVVERDGLWWVQDKGIAFERYLGNPLKRLGKDQYAVFAGDRVDHWVDGRKVGENTRFVPSMAAQLTLGIWLPTWAGTAPWKTSGVRFASVKVWQYDDAGDVRNVLTENVPDNFDASGKPTK
jgi:hypothetical protein